MSDNQFNKTTNHVSDRYCPKCNEKLKAVTIENNVTGRTTHNFLSSEKLKAYRTEFHCLNCRLKYSLEDLRKIEKMKNKKDQNGK